MREICILQISRFFRTPAFPAGSGPDFVNAAVLAETELDSARLINVLHEIEAEMGRERQTRWGPRVIDLDLIDFDGEILPNSPEYLRWRELSPEDQQKSAPRELILPHPRVQDRPFVLVPMADVVPNWRHPVTQTPISELLAAFSPAELAEIEPLSDVQTPLQSQ